MEVVGTFVPQGERNTAAELMPRPADAIAVEPRADAVARDLSLLTEENIVVDTEERDQARASR